MNTKWVIAGLTVMNGALLASHWSLSRNAPALLGGKGVVDAQELLRKEASLLSIERAQLALKIGALSDLASTLKALRPHEGANASDAVSQPAGPSEAEEKLLAYAGIEEKPEPLKIPLMTDEERESLAAYWKSLPDLSDASLLKVDLDGILNDPLWNPAGRELTPDQRSKALKLVRDYFFFVRASQVERFKTLVEPELARLKELGAYVEYDPADGEPPYDGFTITHEEILGKNKQRKYYFPQDQYSDLYHHRQVCQERADESLANLYRLLAED